MDNWPWVLSRPGVLRPLVSVSTRGQGKERLPFAYFRPRCVSRCPHLHFHLRQRPSQSSLTKEGALYFYPRMCGELCESCSCLASLYSSVTFREGGFPTVAAPAREWERLSGISLYKSGLRHVFSCTPMLVIKSGDFRCVTEQLGREKVHQNQGPRLELCLQSC